MLAPTDSLCKIAAALGPDEAIRGTLQIFGWSCRESYILGKILPGRLAGKTILKRDCTSTVEARNIALKTRGCIGFSFEGELKIDQELQKLQKIEELEKKQKPQKAIETNVKKSQLERRKKQLIELDQQTADEEPPIGSFIPAPFQKELEKVNKELTELQQQHDSEQKELDKELHRLKSTLDQELRKPLMQRIDELELATGSVNDGKIKALEKKATLKRTEAEELETLKKLEMEKLNKELAELQTNDNNEELQVAIEMGKEKLLPTNVKKTQLEKRKKELINLEQQTDKDKKDLGELHKELNRMQKQMKKELKKLLEELKDLQMSNMQEEAIEKRKEKEQQMGDKKEEPPEQIETSEVAGLVEQRVDGGREPAWPEKGLKELTDEKKKLERMQDLKIKNEELKVLRRKQNMQWSELAADWKTQLLAIEELEEKKTALQEEVETLEKKAQQTEGEKKEWEEKKDRLKGQNKVLEELKQKTIDRTTLVHFISGSNKLEEPAVYNHLYDSKWETYGACKPEWSAYAVCFLLAPTDTTSICCSFVFGQVTLARATPAVEEGGAIHDVHLCSGSRDGTRHVLPRGSGGVDPVPAQYCRADAGLLLAVLHMGLHTGLRVRQQR
jgi:hypothetical protein